MQLFIKKYLFGHSKGSEAHRAAVIGDTVGDPFKDTSGPSLIIKRGARLVDLAPLFKHCNAA